MNTIGIVLAAGFGTRLRPSTQHCPKPLIPVAGVEPLFHALHTMNALGFKHAIVNAHYLPEKIKKALQAWQALFPNMRLHLSEEEEILGTAGGILKMQETFPELFNGASAMVFNGDTLAGFSRDSLKSMIGPTSSFAYSLHPQHLERYKPLWINAQAEWVGIGPSAPEEGAVAAHFLSVHFLSESDLAMLQEHRRESGQEVEFIDLFNGIYRPLVSGGAKIRGVQLMDAESAYSSECFWFDMTNVEFLLEAQHFLLNGLEEDNASVSPWKSILQARYPGIQELGRGVWYLGQKGAVPPQQKGPSLYIEECSERNENDSYSFELGPFSAVIRQGQSAHGSESFSASEELSCYVKNSVVLVTQDSSGIPSKAGDIHGEVRVI